MVGESFSAPLFAQSTESVFRDELKKECSQIILQSRLRATPVIVSSNTEVPSKENVAYVMKVTQCNWELIRESARKKAMQLTGRLNLIKGLSASVTVLGAGGSIASATGNNTGLTIGSGAVALIGIFTGIFGSESTISRRDKCNQLVTLDPTIQTTFSVWSLKLADESFRKGFTTELQNYNAAIDSGVKGCIADSWTS